MSRKTTKSILSRDEIRLLLNSEEPKNIELYGNLYSVLYNLQNLKAVSLDQLSDIDNKAKASLTYNKKTLIDNVIKEWYAERVSEEDPTKNVRCGLCNTPNKYLYYIRNRKNNILLNVGSHCITKFPGIEGYIEQKKQLSQIHKGHKIINRRNEFYDKFPDCEKIISDAEKYFNTLPILLPYNLYTKMNSIIIRMRLIFTKYINEGKKPYESTYDSFQLFQLAINQYEAAKSESDVFVSKNSKNPLICERSEIDWMISNNKHDLLDKIATNNGRYTLNTLKNMWSIDYFIKKFDMIFSKNQSNYFKFKTVEDESIILSLSKFGYEPSVSFTSNINDFMIGIGAKCIIDNDFSFDDNEILKVCIIRNIKSNLISILNYIEDIIDKMNYAFILDESTNSLFLIRKGDKSIRHFKPYEFMVAYSKKILFSEENLNKYLYNLCHGTKNTKWITQERLAQQGIDEKINKLYKEYKEMHDRYYW